MIKNYQNYRWGPTRLTINLSNCKLSLSQDFPTSLLQARYSAVETCCLISISYQSKTTHFSSMPIHSNDSVCASKVFFMDPPPHSHNSKPEFEQSDSISMLRERLSSLFTRQNPTSGAASKQFWHHNHTHWQSGCSDAHKQGGLHKRDSSSLHFMGHYHGTPLRNHKSNYTSCRENFTIELQEQIYTDTSLEAQPWIYCFLSTN